MFQQAPSAYPNGCHVAEVEIDPETGVAAVVRYTAGGDFGTLVNPLLVEGQVHGGVVQGIGQALLEHVHYDESGQLMTAPSWITRCRGRTMRLLRLPQPCGPATTNPLGAKGCGEAGCAGALPSVMNAVVDALAEHGVTHVDMPATPLKLWQAIRAGARTSAFPSDGIV